MAKDKTNTAADNITPEFMRGLQDAENVSEQTNPNDARMGEDVSNESFGSWLNNTSSKLSNKKNNRFSKYGPSGVLIGLLFGLMLGINSLTTLMPFHLSANILDKLNAQDTGLRVRSGFIVKRLIGDGTLVKSGLPVIGTDKYKSISTKLEQKLRANGIDVVTDSGGKVTHLEFEVNGVKQRIPPAEFESFRIKNTAFNLAYTNSTRTKLGQFYDSIANKFFSTFGIDRNRLKDFRSSGDAEVDSKKLQNIVTDATTDSNGIKTTRNRADEGKDSSGNGTGTRAEDANGVKSLPVEEVDGNIKIGTGNPAEVGAVLRNKAQVAAGAGQALCGVMNGIAAVGLISAGIETGRLIALTSSFLESIDKIKAGQGGGEGEGDTTAANVWSEWLTVRHTRKDTKGRSSDEIAAAAEKAASENATGDSTIDYSIERTTERKSAMESHGILWLVSGAKIPKNDISTVKFSVESSGAFIKNVLNWSVNMRTGCIITSIVSGVVFGALTFFPPGAGIVLKQVVKTGAKVAMGAALGAALSVVLPSIAQKIAIDYVTDAIGEDLGSALYSGAEATLSNASLVGGLRPSSHNEAVAYYAETQKVLAEYGEMERLAKSPFDATSEYTFLGSIIGKLIPYTAQIKSVSGIFTSIGSLFSQSMAAILPTASAQALSATDIDRNTGNCPFLEGIGLQGSAACHAYMTTNLGVANSIPPEDIMQMLCDWGDLTGCNTENPTIIKRSNKLDYPALADNPSLNGGTTSLSAYIDYCANRQSPFGQNDTTITGVMSSVSTDNAGIDGALSSVPLLGDMIDIIDGIEQTQTGDGWATGSVCARTGGETADSGGRGSTLEYNRIDVYSQFIQDERIMEIISDNEQPSIVAKYLGVGPVNEGGGSDGGLKQGGLTAEEAEDFMTTYWDTPTSDICTYLAGGQCGVTCNGGSYPAGKAALNNCVGFSTYFANKYTSFSGGISGDGGQTAHTLINTHGWKSSTEPVVYSIFSYGDKNWSGDNNSHTGVILGIHDDRIIIGQAGCGSGKDFSFKHIEQSLSAWKSKHPDAIYAYLDQSEYKFGSP
jgi:hypothetical protein